MNWTSWCNLHIVLIDCENLTSDRQRAVAFRWRDFQQVELFGRAIPMQAWLTELARHSMTPTALYPIPEDAPSQAADDAIAHRVRVLAAENPELVVIASNDNGFAACIDILAAQGIPALQQHDLSSVEILRLVFSHLAKNGRAEAAAVGTITAERFGFSLKGRLNQLAPKAGLSVGRDAKGVYLTICGSTPKVAEV